MRRLKILLPLFLFAFFAAPSAWAQNFQRDQNCVAYRAEEVMLFFNEGVVWGTSCQVSASLDETETGWVARARLPVDSLATDSERRDADLRENYFHAGQHPQIAFESAPITSERLEQARAGEPFKLPGQLSVKGQLQEVNFTLQVEEGRLVGKTAASMRRLGIEPPKLVGGAFIEVRDEVEIHLDFPLSQVEGANRALRPDQPAEPAAK